MTNFKPMLAKAPDDLSKLRFPVMVQPKLDGIRASVVNGKLVSRTLKPIPNAEIRAALERPEFEGLDGELIVGDPRDPDAYRTTTTFVMSESKTGAQWTYYVFDLWNHPGPNIVRSEAVRLDSVTWTDTPISYVPTKLSHNAGELETFEAACIAEGYEGVITRDPNALYKFGRSGKTGPLLKIKRFIDFEAEVTGVYEEQHNGNVATTNALGRTERSTAQAGKTGKGTLGGLCLRALNGPAKGVEFRCGTGFNAAQRASLWAEADSLIEPLPNGTLSGTHDALNGRVAKIKSFPIGVKDKPRFPVFLGWRDMEIDG